MKRYISILFFTLVTPLGFSQIHEVGFFMGGSNFIGDIGATNYVYPNKLGGGLVYKYNINPRIALRGNYTFIGIKGDDKQSSNIYRKQRGINFTNTIHEFAAGIEFNFFNYNIREWYMDFTPYILAQVATFKYKQPVGFDDDDKIILKRASSYTLPIGIGIKGRLSDHMAYALESSVRFTFKDDLDYTTNKISTLNFGGNGNDTYVFTAFSIVYSFGRPPCFSDLEE